MENKIAVCLQCNDLLDSFSAADRIAIYEKHDGWRRTGQFPVSVKDAPDLNAFREQVRRTIERLEECRVIASKELSGLAFGEFDKAGFHIFDIPEYNDEVLDGIIEDIKKQEAERREQNLGIAGTHPEQTAVEGVYYFNLAAVQKEHPELSSKVLLKDFLKSTPFLELHLICVHIPPWLEDGGYNIKSDTLPDGTVRAVITKNNCGEGK